MIFNTRMSLVSANKFYLSFFYKLSGQNKLLKKRNIINLKKLKIDLIYLYFLFRHINLKLF